VDRDRSRRGVDGAAASVLRAGPGPPVATDIGPVLDLEDVVGGKVCALVPMTELAVPGCQISGQRRRLVASSVAMVLGDGERDLAALVVPRVGELRETRDPWEPFRLLDAGGVVVIAVSAFLSELQAAARPAATQRSYAH
jgi:hypothetical protein